MAGHPLFLVNKKAATGVRLDLAGAIYPEDYRQKLERLDGWNCVKYHGELSRHQLAGMLGNARAGLVLHHPIPNELNAMPIKLFEYMAVGLPVIASDFPVLRRIVEDAKCGILVDSLNPVAISKAMLWVLEHPAEAEAMGDRGRRAVMAHYNWDIKGKKLVALYGKLLENVSRFHPFTPIPYNK